jgi:hypothetical protein
VQHGVEVNLSALTDHEAATSSGVEHGHLLIAFAEAMVRDDEAVLTYARHAVIEGISPEAMVDAAGVASNFERMVRIADATGIQLDARMAALSQEVRDTLHLERFTVYTEME